MVKAMGWGCSLSMTRVISIPFKGGKLFGQALEPLSIENKDKRFFSRVKRSPAEQKSQSFLSSSSARFRDFNPLFKTKWN